MIQGMLFLLGVHVLREDRPGSSFACSSEKSSDTVGVTDLTRP